MSYLVFKMMDVSKRPENRHEEAGQHELSEYAFAMGSKPPHLISADPRWKGDLPALPVEPDPRSQNMMIGTMEDLEREAASWERGPQIPERVERMLDVSRGLFVHSYFVHEFAVVAVVWSLLAVEASLRLALRVDPSDPTGFKKLIGRAHGRGLLTLDEMVQLDGGREFRNRLIHTEGQTTFALGMSVPLLAVAHTLIARVFERAPASSTKPRRNNAD